MSRIISKYWLSIGYRADDGRLVSVSGVPIDDIGRLVYNNPTKLAYLEELVHKLMPTLDTIQPGTNHVISEDPVTGLVIYIRRITEL